MKIYNHLFHDFDDLDSFLNENAIRDSSSLMIQCFDGQLIPADTQYLLHYLIKKFPHSHIIGSSTDGEIIDAVSKSNSIVLSFAQFETSTIEPFRVSFDDGSYQAGVALGNQAKKIGAKVMILFASAFHSNSDRFMEGISYSHPALIVAGGVAGDNGAFKETYVMLGSSIYRNDAVALFLYGEELNVHNSYSFNWIPIGPSFLVTHSHENIVYTLDNIPILQIYREYLGDAVADQLPTVGVAFPILFYSKGELIGRAPMALSEDGGLAFGGTIAQGTEVQLGIGNLQIILETSAITAHNLSKHSPQALFIYSCMARRRFLGSSVNIELLPLQSIAPTSGFFTYGEFFSHSNGHGCSLLNQTMTVLALSEGKVSLSKKVIPSTPDSQNKWSLITFNALSHLIDKTSIDLQILNSSLQRRVNEEIRNNREKDKLMIAQSKRATMGEMMSMIAHQWRQPIATIGLVADNLMLDAQLNEITTQRVTDSSLLISQQVQHLSKTIDDFTKYFRPDNTLEVFYIRELFEEVMAIIGKSLEHSNIQVISDFDQNSTLHSYKRELIQICLNLINNARDALLDKNPDDPHIRFIHRNREGKDQIRIADNAGGISDAIAERIFEPYFSTKSEKNGTGLGLYMSKTIAQQHLKGDLVHYNDQDGAVFIITISTNGVINE